MTCVRVRRSEHRGKALAKLREVLVAQHTPLLVHHAMMVEEPERRPKAAVIDELDHRVQLVQPILQRRAGQGQARNASQGP